MNYQAWVEQVPVTIQQGPLWSTVVYQKALFMYDLTWKDTEKLVRDYRGRAIAEQLIRSSGSISAALLVIAQNNQRNYRPPTKK